MGGVWCEPMCDFADVGVGMVMWFGSVLDIVLTQKGPKRYTNFIVHNACLDNLLVIQIW